MKRREFITLIGGAAAGWQLASRAQLPKIPVIGFLYAGSPGPFAARLAAFRQGLKESGYVEGQNVSIEYRWAEGRYDQLPALATDLVHRHVTAIAAVGTAAPALAAKAATSTIPIVFQTAVDPVANGLVNSFNQPGGNVTGVTRVAVELEAKSLELLRRLVPDVAVFAFLLNPNGPSSETELKYAQDAASALAVSLDIISAGTDDNLDTAFDSLDQLRARALLIGTNSFFNSHTERLAALALRHAVPAVYSTREFAAAGGLISYGASLTDSYRQVGSYVGRILAGAKPADLPVLQPTKFDLTINLRTAKALGVTIPPTLLAIADEVIE